MAHGGHPGIVKIQRCRDRETVWWPGIDPQIEEMMKSYVSCTLSEKSAIPRQRRYSQRHGLQNHGNPFKIDIFGEVVVASNSQRFLEVKYDLHSKWPEIAATTLGTTKSIIDILEKLFTKWGLPRHVTIDNRPQFVSTEFTEFLTYYDIHHHRTSRYDPQSRDRRAPLDPRLY